MLLWVFTGQAQWLLFMTLCRGFMTGAQQPPRPSALGPLRQAEPKRTHTRRTQPITLL